MTVALRLQPEVPPLADDGAGGLRISGTRVSLDTIVHAYSQRATPEQIAEDFSTVSLAQVYAVIAYYLKHRDEVDAYLRRRGEEATELRRQIEAQQGMQPTRAELLARWEKKFGTPFPNHPHGSGT